MEGEGLKVGEEGWKLFKGRLLLCAWARRLFEMSEKLFICKFSRGTDRKVRELILLIKESITILLSDYSRNAERARRL